MLNQTYADFELILIDDCSFGETNVLLKAFAEKDHRIRVYRNKTNQGIAKSRNIGLYKTCGTYYCPMDHDDISLPTRLEKEVDYLETHPNCAAVGCHVEIINETGYVVGMRKYPTNAAQLRRILVFESPLCNPSAMVRLSAIRNEGLYDVRYPGCEDYDMWFRLGLKHNITNINEFLFQYRVSSQQTRKKNTKQLLRYTQQIKRKWLFTKNYFYLPAIGLFMVQFLLFLLPGSFLFYFFGKLKYGFTLKNNQKEHGAC